MPCMLYILWSCSYLCNCEVEFHEKSKQSEWLFNQHVLLLVNLMFYRSNATTDVHPGWAVVRREKQDVTGCRKFTLDCWSNPTYVGLPVRSTTCKRHNFPKLTAKRHNSIVHLFTLWILFLIRILKFYLEFIQQKLRTGVKIDAPTKSFPGRFVPV